MDRPNRLPDRITFHQEYVRSGKTQRVSRGTKIIPGGRHTPPVVTEWTEREEEVPGHFELYIDEIWYESQTEAIGMTRLAWEIPSEERHLYYQLTEGGTWESGKSYWIGNPPWYKPWDFYSPDLFDKVEIKLVDK